MTQEQEILSILRGLNACTLPGEGVSRFSYTPEYKKAAGWLREYMAGLGLSVREDAVGTLYGRWAGSADALPPVMTGSHLDTVPHGGGYDGAAGIACALAAISALRREGYAPRRPVEVVAFAEEEGTRWADSMFSSRFICGRLPPGWREQKDSAGITVAGALGEYGLPADPPPAGPLPFCFLELHIEQGPVLWRAGEDIGAVAAIAGMRNLEVSVHGGAGHAGTTPMELRRDALCLASQLILEIRGLASRRGPGTVATVGRISVVPGAANVIPGSAEFSVDLRSGEEETLAALCKDIEDACAAAGKDGFRTEVRETFREAPVALSADLCGEIRRAAEALGLRVREMTSGAGHDSMVMASACPTGMIFIPCRDGLSHCPQEYASPAQLSAGADVLAAVLREAAS